MKYDLTVIIPVYNTEKYLRRCLDSIVHQDNLKDCSLRVICVNDGSTDCSEEIIKEYAAKYPFIELFSKENGGLADVRNFGLAHIEDSLYTVSLDSDDFWEESFITEFINVLKVHPYSEKYRKKEDYMVVKHAAWSKICKTSLYNGIQFPKGKLYEDLAVMPYLTSKSTDIAYIKKPLINYVINTPGSIMNSSKSNIFDIYDALKYLFTLFGDDFDKYKKELQYLALEHLCIGHTYRLLKYPAVKKQDFKDIILFMEKYFGKNWEKNKYIKQGVQKVNIHSKLAYIVPLFLKVLKNEWFGLLLLVRKN